MADAARKQGSSNFAVACSLLSQYIKGKGSAADLGFGIAQVVPKGKSESLQRPITMSLLPGADVSGGHDSERESEGEVVSQENPMDLFPQPTGFLTSASPDSRVAAQKSQLTIFYGGKVLVFDNFPAEKAKNLMQLASKGSSTADNLTCVPLEAVISSRSFSYKKNSTLVPKAAGNPAVPQLNLSKPTQPNLSDLPIARKVSLQRFLEKRKDRINARAPYQMTRSPQVTTSINQADIKSWLGLGHHFATPDLILSSEYSR